MIARLTPDASRPDYLAQEILEEPVDTSATPLPWLWGRCPRPPTAGVSLI